MSKTPDGHGVTITAGGLTAITLVGGGLVVTNIHQLIDHYLVLAGYVTKGPAPTVEIRWLGPEEKLSPTPTHSASTTTDRTASPGTHGPQR